MAQGKAAAAPDMSAAFRQAMTGAQRGTWPDLPLVASLRQYRLYKGTDCATLFEKSENIRRHMRAVEDQNAEMLRLQKGIALLDRWILVATLTRDTCLAFLDMAGALIPSVSAPSTLAVGAIDTASTWSERRNGIGDARTQALRSANTVNSLARAPGAFGTILNFKAQQAIDIAQGMAGIQGAQSSAERQVEMNKMAVSTVADMVKGMADLSVSTTSPASHPGRVVGGVAVAIKTAYNYNANVAKALDDYMKADAANDRAVLEQAQAMMMARLRKTFAESLIALDRCRVQNGLA